MALPFTDDFTNSSGSNKDLSVHNAGWVVSEGGFSVLDTTDDVQATGGGDNVAYWSTDAPDANHAVSMTLSSVTSGVYSGVVARWASTGNFYALQVHSGQYLVSRYNGGSQTEIRTSTSVTTSANDVFRLEVEGTGATVTLRVYRNGVQLGADISDSSGSRHTTAGYGGIYGYASNASCRVTSFTLENLSGGGGSSIGAISHYYRQQMGG